MKKRSEKEGKYELIFNGEKIIDSPISKEVTEIEIPDKTLPGTYEITVKFPNNPEKEEEMGIVIHVKSKSKYWKQCI